jgi:hypothetical protein
VRSLHIIGSRQYGGADPFFVRLLRPLEGAGEAPLAVTRRGSPVALALAGAVQVQVHLPLASKWDRRSAWRLRRLSAARGGEVVQAYRGRATRLARFPMSGPTVQVARLGDHDKVPGYCEHTHASVGNTRRVCDHLVDAGLPRERVHLIGNFVEDPQPVNPARRREVAQVIGLPEDALVIYALGRFIAIKGFDDLVRDGETGLIAARADRRAVLARLGRGAGP